MNTKNFKIVSATNPIQHQIIETLAKEIWNEHYISIISLEQIDYMLPKFHNPDVILKQQQEGHQFYLVYFDTIPRGYLSLQPQEDGLFVSKFYLLKSFRGNGLGKKMMAFVEEIAKEMNYHRIYLTVNKHNTHSINFYQKCGFVIEKEAIFDIGNGFVMDDYVMGKC